VNLEISERRVAFRSPLRTSYAELTQRTLFDVRLTGEDGLVGRGEAAPLEPYDGVGDDEVRAALDAYAAVLAGLGPEAEGAIVLDTGEMDVARCVAEIVRHLPARARRAHR
jgi:L-alanine-DL-glutamate epimerase-like enolase superfamily enzyme